MFCWSLKMIETINRAVWEKNGGDDGTRTRGLCRDRMPRAHFTTWQEAAGAAPEAVFMGLSVFHSHLLLTPA
jgi:hypothetical protein